MTKQNLRHKNFLELIPLRNPAYFWFQNDAGRVVVTVPHTGFYAALAQRLFHRPAQSHIALDEYGSFVWLLLDGQHDISAIAAALDAHYHADAYPLHSRLAAYFRILREHRFVSF